MDTKGSIFHSGLVKEVGERGIIVSIISQSACASCHAKGACSASDQQEKEVEINSWQGEFHVGDRVEVVVRESQGFMALFFAYILPLLLLLIALISFLALLGNEGLAALAALSILIPYYIGLFYFRNRLRKALSFTIKKLD